jgi:hypothetical protein
MTPRTLAFAIPPTLCASNEAIESKYTLLRCIGLKLALPGRSVMSAITAGVGEKSGLHLLVVSSSEFDVVDGTHSAASKCHRVVASKRKPH